MLTPHTVGGIRYTPPQTRSSTGRIGQYEIQFRSDGGSFSTPISGKFLDNGATKQVLFKAVTARYIRLSALTAVDGGGWTAAAEISVLDGNIAAPTKGTWGDLIDFPLVRVTTALLPTGDVLVWAAWQSMLFESSTQGQTVTAIYHPSSATISEQLVTETKHDMFCPGISADRYGRIVVTRAVPHLRRAHTTRTHCLGQPDLDE